MTQRFYCRAGKRLMDIGLALVALIFLSPIMLLIAFLVRIRLGSPVIFSQERPGLEGKLFTLIKFRTMTSTRDGDENLLPDDQRLTPLGRFLRSTSLDELPELINVLRSEMSLVGPRPLLMRYLDRYTPEQFRRHEVLPGITGWAQVNGRNAIHWEKKFELDVWYVDHQSLWMDLKVLSLTVWSVLARKGITAADHATVPEFLRSQVNPGAIVARVQRSVVVLGAGGYAKVVISTLRASGFEVAELYDDCEDLWGRKLSGVPIVGPLSRLSGVAGLRAVIAIGNDQTRRKYAEQLTLEWIRVVHPRAYVAPEASVGEGTVVCAGAVLQAYANVGAHATVNTGATIDHDCCVEDYAHVAPGSHLSGKIRLGLGSYAVQGVSAGCWTTVGAGWVVIRDLPDNVVAVGCPEHIIHSEPPRKRVA